jgi:hypothetical protein
MLDFGFWMLVEDKRARLGFRSEARARAVPISCYSIGKHDEMAASGGVRADVDRDRRLHFDCLGGLRGKIRGFIGGRPLL